MRNFVILGAAALAACTNMPPAPGAPAERPGPVAPNPSGGPCDATGGQAFVGQIATVATGQAILAATHAKMLRWESPGMMITMEFSAERVNARYGPDLKILAVTCG